jgi:hypothetical protein
MHTEMEIVYKYLSSEFEIRTKNLLLCNHIKSATPIVTQR